MATANPLSYIANGITTLVDAIKVTVSGSPVTREVLAIGDDTDSGGTPIVAQVDPATRGLKVVIVGGGGSSSAAALSSVIAAVSSVAVLAMNANRKSASVFNNSSSTMYLAAGIVASTTLFTTKIPAGALYELGIDYLGPFSAVWDTASGSALVTEYT